MKYIIFDIDGTLANTKEVDDQCVIKAFIETFGINILDIEWTSLKNATDWGITEECILHEEKREPTSEEYQKMHDNLLKYLKLERERDSSQFKEIPGAVSFFERLKNINDYHLGIATGAWEESAKLKLESIELDYTNIPFCNSTYYKRREDIMLDVIKQLDQETGGKADQIIYFGDGEWDYKTCKKLDIPLIGIDVKNSGNLKALGTEHVFQDYLNPDQILKVIEEI